MSIIRPLSEISRGWNYLMGYETGVQKEWFCGIKGISFIFMGDWNDSLVGYKGYAINEPTVTDSFWELYNEENPAPTDYKSPEYREYEDNFNEWLRERADEVKNFLDEIIENYKKAA